MLLKFIIKVRNINIQIKLQPSPPLILTKYHRHYFAYAMGRKSDITLSYMSLNYTHTQINTLQTTNKLM